MPPGRQLRIRIALVTVGVCLAGTVPLRAQGRASHPSANQWGGTPQVPLQSATNAAPHSMLDQPPSAAEVWVANNQLTIMATNASLTDVIRDVAAKTGMQVEGNSRDERVFGVYGPGQPPEVLTALLYDSGYNVLMVGNTADGAPRRLVLSARATGPALQSTAGTAVPHSNDEEDETDQAEQPPMQAPPAPAPNNTVPPAAIPGQVKTPQQMLEELQRMRQGMQQGPQATPAPQAP